MESAIMSIGFWIGGLFIGLGIGYKIGIYIERQVWNELIYKGKISKPTKKRTLNK